MDEYGWEEEEDGKTSTSKHAKIKRPPSLDKYMDIMDRELAKTDVGKSFEKQKRSPKKTEKEPKVQTPSKDINEEDDDFQPVDIDLNTVKNLLESYGAQEGLPGPASNILGSMSVNIPPDMDNIENGENTITVPKESRPDSKRSKVSFEGKPRMDREEKPNGKIENKQVNRANMDQKETMNSGNKPIPKARPKPAAKHPEGGTPKTAPPRPPPPRAVRPRARLDSKETNV